MWHLGQARADREEKRRLRSGQGQQFVTSVGEAWPGVASVGDLKGGELSGTKRVLAERLSAVVDWVVEEGRDIAKDDVGAVDADASD